MSMPERSFGRTVRYRRTKLGLSQAQLAELVGRSTATIRAWERDKTRPNDTKVISALSAILGVSERQMFEKANVAAPTPEATSDATLEEVFAELDPTDESSAGRSEESDDVITQPVAAAPDDDPPESTVVEEPDPVGAMSSSDTPSPAYIAPPDRYVTTPVAPTVADASYMEDRSQRQLYRVRTLATIVALVALVVAFLWAVGEGLGALGDWWDEFFGNLRL